MPPPQPNALSPAVYAAIGDIDPACQREIEQLYPELDLASLGNAFRQLSQDLPHRAIDKAKNALVRGQEPLGDRLVFDGEPSKDLQKLLRKRTPSQIRGELAKLQRHSLELYTMIISLRPELRAVIEEPYKSPLKIGDLDRLAGALREFNFALNSLIDDRAAADGREGIHPVKGFIWTVANLVKEAGYLADGRPSGAVFGIVDRVLERTGFLKNVPSSVQKAMRDWPGAAQI